MKRLTDSFFLIFTIVVCSYGMATVSVATTENFLYNAILACVIICFGTIKMLRNPNINKKFFLLLPLSLIPLLLTFRFNLISLYLMISLVWLRNDIFTRKGRSIFLIISIFLFFLIFFANVFWGYNDIFSRDIWNPREKEYIFRSALGFTHPNQAMLKSLGIVLVAFVGITKKKVVLYALVSTMLVLFLYSFTLSRTVVSVVVFASLLLFFFRNKLDKPVSCRIKKVISIYPLFFLLLSLVAMHFSNNEFLNLLFSGRLGFYKYAVEVFGFTLLGSPVIEKGSSFVIDSSYFNTLISKGIIFFLVYATIIRYSVMKSVITYKKGILLTTFFLSAFTETMFFKFDLMYAMFLIIFFEDKKDAQLYEKSSDLS